MDEYPKPYQGALLITNRVFSTRQAYQAARSIESIVSSDFGQTLSALIDFGDALSDQDQWGGRLAREFCENDWPRIRKVLADAQTELDELSRMIGPIVGNVFHADGNLI